MRAAAGIRRRNQVSGRRFFGHPLRTFVRHYKGSESRSVLVVLPGFSVRVFYWEA